jgi:hypothetical protein
VACFQGVTGRGWSNEPVVSARGLRDTLAAARLADDGEVEAGDRPPMPEARDSVDLDEEACADDAEGGAIGVGLGFGEVTEG